MVSMMGIGWIYLRAPYSPDLYKLGLALLMLAGLVYGVQRLVEWLKNRNVVEEEGGEEREVEEEIP